MLAKVVYGNQNNNWFHLHKQNKGSWLIPMSTSSGKKMVKCFILATLLHKKIIRKERLLQWKREYDSTCRTQKKWLAFVDILINKNKIQKPNTKSFTLFVEFFK